MEITMPVEEFQRKCIKLLDEVSKKGLIVIITKNRLPIAKMIPVLSKKTPASQ